MKRIVIFASGSGSNAENIIKFFKHTKTAKVTNVLCNNEYAKVFDNYYGTSRSLVGSEIEAGRNVILEIDWQGAKQVKSVELEIISIFILPPNYQALRERLLNRKKDNIQTIERRMSAALEEISHYKEFDFIVINDDFEQTLTKLNEIIVSPSTNLHRQSNFYDNFVSQIMAQQD